jgi:hypothetical protein
VNATAKHATSATSVVRKTTQTPSWRNHHASTIRPLAAEQARDHRERGGDGQAPSLLAAIRRTCSRRPRAAEPHEEPEPAEPDRDVVERADHGDEIGHDVDRRKR